MTENMQELMMSQLDIFSVPPIQTSIVSGEWEQFKTLQALSETSPLTFLVPGCGSKYTDLSKCLLHVKFRVINGITNEKYLATEQFTVINNTLNSLFSDVKLDFNQTTVSTSHGMNHIRSYIEQLFSYNESSKGTHLTSSLYYQDEAGGFDAINSNGNAKRAAFVNGSRECELMGRLHCNVMNTERYMLNDIDFRITLTRNPSSLVVLGAANLIPKVVITDATLWVRRVLPNPGILIAHSKILEGNTAKYPFKRVDLSNYTIAAGTFQKVIESMFVNRLPSRVIVGMCKNSAYSGAINQNVLNFEHFDLNHLALSVNSNIINSTPFRPNFEEKQSIVPYLLGFYNVGIGCGDDGYCVSRDCYSGGYALFCWDLSPCLTSSDGINSIMQKGNCRLELGFAKELPTVVNLLVYSETPDVIEIDRNRQIHQQLKS
jgi:hypothetical protein